MKHNRIAFLLLTLFLMLSLCGCVNGPDISEEQSDLVAEYAAGVLLRYSNQYDRRLITKEQIEKENQKKNADSTAAPETTAAPSATPTPVPSSENEPVPNDSGMEEQSTEQPTVPLNEIYRIEGLNFSYQSYRFCKKYNSQIKAEDGQTLLVVEFNVKNQSGKKKKVSLGKKKIAYKLMVDNSEYQPSISILENMGLTYLDTTIPAGKSENAVLIFRMSEERKEAAAISLAIEDGNRVSMVKLK